MSISKLHAAAISYAEAGYPVFPCVENGKAPACRGGFHDATTDRSQIDRWWEENPAFNIAYSPQAVGLGVVDPDGSEGQMAWEQLRAEHDIPDTYTVSTPRGGRHYIFAGALPQTAWTPTSTRCLGEHIDTRGIGSYVLAPPSVVNGQPYKVINDIEPAPVPAWMVERLRRRDVARATSDATLDDPGNILRARAYLDGVVAGTGGAVAGRGGNNTTYRVACEVFNLGVSTDVCRELLTEIYNPACVPPWSADELGAIIANAATYAQNEAGAWAAAPATEVFAGFALDKLLAESASEPAPRSRFHFEDVFEQDDGRDVPFLVPGLIPDMATVLIVGAKGTFKSFIAQHLLMSLAARVPMFQEPSRYGATFFGAHEGRSDMRRRRRHAWETLHSRRGERYPYFIAPAPRVIVPGECEEFREQIRVQLRKGSTRIVAIALDTVAKCLAGLDENSAQDMGVFVAFCDSLVEEFQCPVIALHHTGKAGSGSRGSNSLEAGFGTVIDASRSGKKLVSLSVRYHKDAEEPDQPFHLEAQLVAGSLVFTPVSVAEFKAQTLEDDPFARPKIGAVLRKLGAVGYENRIAMQVLASEITPKVENETIEARDRSVAKSKGILGKLAAGSLKGYCEKIGREWVWWLPDAEPGIPTE
jgi:hypothetical protein